MTASDILIDGFERVRQIAHRVAAGAELDLLTWRADPEANTIDWLLWHLARGQDAQVADVAGTAEVWPAFAERFALPFALDETGYAQSSDEVARVRAPADDLLAYLDAVTDATVAYLGTLDDSDFARVVDEAWDPPVTLGVRLVSVLSDDLQHAGQAAYVKGLAERAAS